jgi:hypothetical protein
LGRLRAREEKKANGLGTRGLKEKRKEKGKGVGPARKEGREERGFSFLKKHFSNSFFKTSIKQETMHLKHDAQSLIISNLFK